jgi:hypothetical protein
MRGKLLFIGGVAAGFVLGARAGREKYEELVVRSRKLLDHPTVQEAAGVAQAQANRLYEQGKDRLGQTKLGEKLSTNGSSGTPELPSSGESLASSTTGSAAKPGSTSATTSSTTPPATGRKASGSSTTH